MQLSASSLPTATLLWLCASGMLVTLVTAADNREPSTSVLAGPLGSIDVSGLSVPNGATVSGELVVDVPEKLEESLASLLPFAREARLVVNEPEKSAAIAHTPATAPVADNKATQTTASGAATPVGEVKPRATDASPAQPDLDRLLHTIGRDASGPQSTGRPAATKVPENRPVVADSTPTVNAHSILPSATPNANANSSGSMSAVSTANHGSSSGGSSGSSTRRAAESTTSPGARRTPSVATIDSSNAAPASPNGLHTAITVTFGLGLLYSLFGQLLSTAL